ncbi:ABC transporter permease [Stappia stellulata]|uniref:ABC transporter permease n=1 Tax=Stappia stellulata TaxID=71235 RepID=UPI000413CB88|nr:ABC transporter permease [Stappia stellulata]
MDMTKQDSLLRTQIRVIGALVLRETRVTFGKAKMGYLWAIMEPIFGTAFLTLIFSIVTRHPPIGTSFTLFFATGILTFQFYSKLADSLMAVFQANRGLMAYPLVKEVDVVIARFLLIAATYTTIIIVFFGGLIALQIADYPAHLDTVLLAILAVALLGLGAGLTNAVVMMLWPTWKQLHTVLTRPLFFISGVFFIPSNFPPDIRYILSWNPILHCIELFRAGYYPMYNPQTLDVSYLFFYIAILLLIAFGSERLYRKHQK